MATAFTRTTPAAEVLPHRHAWATPSDRYFEVISRDGETRYQVALLTDGSLRCSCPAKGHCWHQDRVALRILREGVPASITEPSLTADDLFARL